MGKFGAESLIRAIDRATHLHFSSSLRCAGACKKPCFPAGDLVVHSDIGSSACRA